MIRYFLIIFLLHLSVLLQAQQDSCRFVFYNVENIFDTIDNPGTRDEEFLPDGNRSWNGWKYQQKLNKTYQTLMAVKEWQKLSLIGLCEIENRQVLANLIYKTPLYQYGYQVIHKDSPDERGVDVALLYRPEDFSVEGYEAITITFPFDSTDKTRDILYVKGVLFGADTLHVFINHWPSRYGGYMKTKKKREYAAEILSGKVDSISAKNKNAAIVIAGDFNDEPTDSSIERLMQKTKQTKLINLLANEERGTTKYRSQWFMFDQLIVSENLFANNTSSALHVSNAEISRFPFLFSDDERYGGKKLFRTFTGPKYMGGYSDHLPVFMDFKKRQ